MSQPKLLIKVVEELDRLRIPYMVTGSIASSLMGQPRSTHDVDLVVSIHKHHAEKLANVFPEPDYYLDKDMILDAIDSGGMFNMMESASGAKVDFWLLMNDDFDQNRFQRRVKRAFGEEQLYFSTPEDTILMKLKWAKMSGGSEKQFKDCLSIYEVQHEKLEMEYLDEWSLKLGVNDLLRRILEEGKV